MRPFWPLNEINGRILRLKDLDHHPEGLGKEDSGRGHHAEAPVLNSPGGMF